MGVHCACTAGTGRRKGAVRMRVVAHTYGTLPPGASSRLGRAVHMLGRWFGLHRAMEVGGGGGCAPCRRASGQAPANAKTWTGWGQGLGVRVCMRVPAGDGRVLSTHGRPGSGTIGAYR